MNKDEAREAAELARLNAMTWEQLNPDWTEGGDLTDRFAKSQFDTCPSCGEIDQIRVVNSSWDDVMASVLCCSWQCNGDCPSEAIDNWNRRAASVPRWTRVEERLPEFGQDVAFVVKTTNPTDAYENGRILGGRYSKDGYFCVPGCSYVASHWMPIPLMEENDATKEK